MASTRRGGLVRVPATSLLLYAGTVVFCFLVVIYAARLMDASARTKHERLFNEHQQVQTMLAARAMRGRLEAVEGLITHLAADMLKGYIHGIQSGQSLEGYFSGLLAANEDLAGLSFLPLSRGRFMPDSVFLYRSDTFGSYQTNTMQGIVRNDDITTTGAFWLPPSASSTIQVAMLVRPLRAGGSTIGLLGALVDLGRISSDFVAPLRSGKYGAAYMVDDHGTVVFDHETEVIGRNIFDGLHDSYADLLRFDRTLVKEPSGMDTYTFTVERGGKVSRKLVAWTSVPVGEHALRIALAAPDFETNATLEAIRMQRYLLGGILVFTLLAVTAFFYRYQVALSLRKSEERYRRLAHTAYDWELWYDKKGSLQYVSPSCERISGYGPNEFIQDPDLMERIIHKEDHPMWVMHMDAGERLDGEALDYRIFTRQGRVRHISLVGRHVYDEDGAPMGLRCSIRDITERAMMEKELRYQALHDPLTGLANRTLCLDRIRQTLERQRRRENVYFAVVFMDLDRFKVVNDSLGHTSGDAMLTEVAERVLACVRSVDTVARFGGDEFVILLEELRSPREAVSVIKRIRQAVREPFDLNGTEIRTSCSLGIVLSPTDFVYPEDIVRNANIAMYRAKEAGRDRFKVFNSRMLDQAVQAMTLENDMRRALANDEFFLEYQPIQNAADGKLTGVEALVRWQHPAKGVVSPSLFIPVAEESGIIIDLGLWVLKRACMELRRLRDEHQDAHNLFMSVNLSARQFSQPDLVEQVKAILADASLPPDRLKLEITETTIMRNAESALRMLQELKDLGVRLSIDDFGTGYSSLSYLQRFPVDTLKVDRSFIGGMGHGKGNEEIVRAVIVLAQSLGLEVIAEGVEQEAQLSILQSMDCGYVQGFFFHRPLSSDRLNELLKNGSILVSDNARGRRGAGHPTVSLGS